jgi:hypothetical protein
MEIDIDDLRAFFRQTWGRHATDVEIRDMCEVIVLAAEAMSNLEKDERYLARLETEPEIGDNELKSLASEMRLSMFKEDDMPDENNDDWV